MKTNTPIQQIKLADHMLDSPKQENDFMPATLYETDDYYHVKWAHGPSMIVYSKKDFIIKQPINNTTMKNTVNINFQLKDRTESVKRYQDSYASDRRDIYTAITKQLNKIAGIEKNAFEIGYRKGYINATENTSKIHKDEIQELKDAQVKVLNNLDTLHATQIKKITDQHDKILRDLNGYYERKHNSIKEILSGAQF